MEYFFGVGILGTRASYFMDITLLVAISSPFILLASIVLAIKGYYKPHKLLQMLLFLINLISLLMIQYQIQFLSSFDTLIESSSYNHNIAFYIYIAHSILSTISIILYYSTLYFAKEDHKRRALPGLYSNGHKKMGRISAILIFLTNLGMIHLYWILFVA